MKRKITDIIDDYSKKFEFEVPPNFDFSGVSNMSSMFANTTHPVSGFASTGFATSGIVMQPAPFPALVPYGTITPEMQALSKIEQDYLRQIKDKLLNYKYDRENSISDSWQEDKTI